MELESRVQVPDRGAAQKSRHTTESVPQLPLERGTRHLTGKPVLVFGHPHSRETSPNAWTEPPHAQLCADPHMPLAASGRGWCLPSPLLSSGSRRSHLSASFSPGDNPGALRSLPSQWRTRDVRAPSPFSGCRHRRITKDVPWARGAAQLFPAARCCSVSWTPSRRAWKIIDMDTHTHIVIDTYALCVSDIILTYGGNK